MTATFATPAAEAEHLEASAAMLLALIDDSLAEGDEESAAELAAAHERTMDRLDELARLYA